jgi:hypothetical protein
MKTYTADQAIGEILGYIDHFDKFVSDPEYVSKNDQKLYLMMIAKQNMLILKLLTSMAAVIEYNHAYEDQLRSIGIKLDGIESEIKKTNR